MKRLPVQRGDIWIADLPLDRGDVLRGRHPVIVVSSDRTNHHSRNTTVIPLTSASKPPMPCHVKVSGFGLNRKSTALVEQLTTIPKAYLCFLVGSIADSRKMQEIEQAMKLQLEVA